MRSPVMAAVLSLVFAGQACAADLHIAKPYARPLAIARVGARQLLLADGRSVRLGRPAVAPTSDAATSPDGRFAAYSVWDGRRPVLRMLDLQSGHRWTVRRGALLPVWGAGGRLAYVGGWRGARPEYIDDDLRGRVYAQEGPLAPARAWTTRGGFRPTAWAGARLFVEHTVPSAIGPDAELRLYDGPGRARSVDGPSHAFGAPQSRVVAVRRDARVALLATYKTCLNSRITLLRLRDLVVLHAPRGPQLGAGAWRGNRVLAPVDVDLACIAHPDDDLEIVGVADHRITERVERHIRVGHLRLREPEAPKLVQPRFLGSRHMAAWFTAIGSGGPHAVNCDLVTLWCRRTPRGGPALTAFVPQ